MPSLLHTHTPTLTLILTLALTLAAPLTLALTLTLTPTLRVTPQVLSLINTSEHARVYFVSVCHPCIGGEGALAAGVSRNQDGRSDECVTMIVRPPPNEP